MSFSFGTDPEFMLIDEFGNFRSAIGIVKGSKENRIHRDEHSFYYDNVLAECAIKPAYSKAEAVQNIGAALKLYSEMLRDHKVKLIIQASREYKLQEIEKGKLVESQDGSMILEGRYAGCDPESCAYDMEPKAPTELQHIFKTSNVRTAGGHVHLGTTLVQNSYLQCVALVRLLDLFLGFSSLLIDKDQTSCARRSIYGNAGRFRQPKHGAEYRTLSNFWLGSPRRVELVYDLCEFTIRYLEEGSYENFWRVDTDKMTDDFWNSGGDVRDLHVCHGYDVKLLRQLFIRPIDKQWEKDSRQFMDILHNELPRQLMESLLKEQARGTNDEINKEWKLC